MRPQKFHLIGESQRQAAVAAIAAAKEGQVVNIRDRDRTQEQNSLLHKWFSEIAVQSQDRSFLDVKFHCNLKYGVPLRMQDEMFAWIWLNISERLSHEQLQKWCEHPKNKPKISSGLDVHELRQYMDAMSRDYRQEGFVLTDPEAMQ